MTTSLQTTFSIVFFSNVNCGILIQILGKSVSKCTINNMVPNFTVAHMTLRPWHCPARREGNVTLKDMVDTGRKKVYLLTCGWLNLCFCYTNKIFEFEIEYQHVVVDSCELPAHWWLGARLQYLQRVSNGDSGVLQWAIDMPSRFLRRHFNNGTSASMSVK